MESRKKPRSPSGEQSSSSLSKKPSMAEANVDLSGIAVADKNNVFQSSFPTVCHRKFYIRPVYREFFQLILDFRVRASTLKPRDNQRGLGVMITGTPRIGKSVFLFYVAENLKRQGIHIVITLEDKSYDNEFKLAEYTYLHDNVLNNYSVVHLIDPSYSTNSFLREHNALAIFFTLPTITNFKPYHSKHLDWRYMPTWTKEEMEKCCGTLGVEFSKECFTKWGGVFMDKIRADLMESELDATLEGTTLKDLLAMKDDLMLLPEISSRQWLLHRHPITEKPNPYSKCTLSLPSDYVRKRILQTLENLL